MAAADRLTLAVLEADIATENFADTYKKIQKGAPSRSAFCSARLSKREVYRALATVAAGFDVKRDFLIIGKAGQAGALDLGDVYKHIFAAALGCDEAEAFGGVEPFHCAIGHVIIPFM